MTGLTLGVDVSVRRIGVALTGPMVRRCDAAAVNLADRGWTWTDAAQLMRSVVEDGRRPDAVWIEWPAFVRSSGPNAAFMAGRALQVAWHAATMLGYPTPQLIVPDKWKRLAGVAKHKAATYDELVDRCQTERRPYPSKSGAKPPVYLTALDHGFEPSGSQDAADAALIAVAGRRHTHEGGHA